MSSYSITLSESKACELTNELAESTGLTTTASFRDILPRRHSALIEQWSYLANQNRDIWPGVLNNLCKGFLASLVTAYKARPSAQGIHSLLLTAVVANSYFRDFMVLGCAPDLPDFYARQLRRNNTWSRQNPDQFRASLETLKQLLYYSRKYRRNDPLSPWSEAALAHWLARQGNRSMEAYKIKIVRSRWSGQAYDERMKHAINCHRDNAELCFVLQRFILTPRADAFRLLLKTARLESTYIGSAVSAGGCAQVYGISPSPSRPASLRTDLRRAA